MIFDKLVRVAPESNMPDFVLSYTGSSFASLIIFLPLDISTRLVGVLKCFADRYITRDTYTGDLGLRTTPADRYVDGYYRSMNLS